MTLPERVVFICIGVVGMIDGIRRWRRQGREIRSRRGKP